MSSHPIPAGGTPTSAGKVCLQGEDHKLESREVARNWPPIPEQGETGPPPEELKSEEGFPVKTQWMTSWTLYPQVGRGT